MKHRLQKHRKKPLFTRVKNKDLPGAVHGNNSEAGSDIQKINIEKPFAAIPLIQNGFHTVSFLHDGCYFIFFFALRQQQIAA